MSASISDNLNSSILRQLAGERSFERGEDYFAEERVRSLVEFEGVLAATVEGTEDYRVKLWAEGSGLGFWCDCPYADEGNFCKHCVAVGLAWLNERDARTESGHEVHRGIIRLDGARAFLEKQDKKALVEMVLRDALDNERACERLIEAARTNPPRSPKR